MTAAKTRGRTAAGLGGLMVAASAFGITAVDHAARTTHHAAAPASRVARAEHDREPTLRCGKERWAVKTATDPAAASIDRRSVKQTTIAKLTALAAPQHPKARVAPVETSLYRVHATLTTYLREDDNDYHLVLEDSRGNTMIAEIPSPGCALGSRLREEISSARGAFDARLRVTGTAKTATLTVTVTGVGFFDFDHNQTGVARNAIELHPVTAIRFGS